MPSLSSQPVKAFPSGVGPTEPLRVLFFDYFTRGIHNFTRVVEAAAPGEASFHLLHLGSFRDPSIPRTECIEGIPCEDIAVFGNKNLEEILRSLRPDVVVGTNMSQLADRALFLTCSKLMIPTVYLQHGSLLEYPAFLAAATQADQKWTIADYVQRIPKYAKVIPWYVSVRRGGWYDPLFWKVLWTLLKSPTVSNYFPVAPEKLWPTLALVYNQTDAEMLMRVYHFPADRIQVVGNPELDTATRRRDAPWKLDERARLVESIGLDPGTPILFYPDEGLTDGNVFGWTPSFRADRLRELYASCRQAGVQLLIRPRSHGLSQNDRVLEGCKGVVVSRSIALVDSIDIAAVVVGTISTVLETAVVLRKPILSPLWYISGRANDSPYLKYRAATAVESPDDLSHMILQAANGCLRANTEEFATKRLGVLDGSASKRIVAAILGLGRSAQTSQNRGQCPARETVIPTIPEKET